jgi:hypothetical protein
LAVGIECAFGCVQVAPSQFLLERLPELEGFWRATPQSKTFSDADRRR